MWNPPRPQVRLRALRLAPLAAAALLAACAPLQTRQSLQAVNVITLPHTGTPLHLLRDPAQQQDAQAQIDALLSKPLSADDAVRIALLGSPALQGLIAQTQADSADSTQSARLTNPVFGFERLLIGGGVEITRSLSFGLLDLLTLPTRSRLNDTQQTQLRLSLARAVLRTAAQARLSWVRAVAAQQTAAYDRDVVEAAKATAILADRMRQAGNFTKLDAAQQGLFAADSQLRLSRAELAATQSREALVQALGLSAEQAARLALPTQLPEVPKQPSAAAPMALQTALDQRLDVQLARADYTATAQAAGLARATSLIEHVELGGVRKTYSDAPPQNGFDLSLPLPLFDLGDARRSAAADRVLAARNRAIATARRAASQLREADALRGSAWQQQRLSREQIVPLALTVLDESQLRYNGMLIGTFQLVAAAQTQVQAVREAISAQRNYWLADAAWQAAQLGVDAGPGALPDSTSSNAAPAVSSH
ncbi:MULTISPECIES: TolC family protein [Thiomonas]|uniref:TolC family protein n=1 Tax=Thiomonas TaxID=32012 RepID=UPI0012A7A91C|nr:MULTISPECIES: TolC family protein [Thiomonas]VDY04273.1 putative Integral outer membrane protein TolC, efflux pump component [Thiomonas sp. Bio17B3]VDY08553.1 putative Integral outer membrane protein TolC, efflux pump component [Thiomonas sp. Sup16B3]VDY12520.1 putative Integral outer membrane protein TolC, efflux pump component [Thiomonas sp. OC7]VDY18267.1 putative Integral outer membrane protein TolC, efflux pump component [Thiomonas sp. CB2]HML82610.1 TolC family protein [Thiomonas arse